VRLRLEQSRSWLLRFGALSLLAILATCLLLARTFEGSIRERKIDDARRDVAAQWQAVESRLGRKLSAGGRLGGRERRLLDRTLGTLVRNREVGYVRVRNGRAKPIWSRGAGGRGRSAPGGKALEQALGGRPAGEIVTADVNGPASEELRSYFPLRAGPGAAAAGVLEAGEAFRPIETAAASDARALYLPLLGCGALLFAALLGIAVGTSTRMRRQVASSDEQARRDLLTGLPNRTTFHELVERATAGARREKRQVAIVLMDLDRFKEVNDTLGHHNGDILLKQLAQRLRAGMREAEVVARLGGDEFAILISDVKDKEAAVPIVKRIVETLQEAFVAGGIALQMEASIGIAVYPEDGEGSAALMRAADVAMYAAKAINSGYEFYSATEEDRSRSGRRLALTGELRRAMDERELVLHYQPKVALATGRVEGVEALARWEHPRRGLLPPAEFVPLVEQTNLLRSVTLHLIEVALRQLKDWRKEGVNLTIGVNLSMRNLLDVQLPGELERLLRRWSTVAGSLELEITESMIMSDPRRAMSICTRLHRMGIPLAVDDFGTGYSSLKYLQQLPVDTIKVDKSFVKDMDSDEGKATITRSTIDLAHNLGLKVVAEGVETEEVLRALTTLGCDLAQGFLLSKALPPDELMRWLQDFSLDRREQDDAGATGHGDRPTERVAG
jgi:diguanylate cyclase (GGDEF)-like protein